MSSMQDHTRTTIETGAEIRSRHAVHPDWMAKLEDNRQYQVTKLYVPFGIYVLAAVPICQACQRTGIFQGIDTIPTTCCECDGSGSAAERSEARQ